MTYLYTSGYWENLIHFGMGPQRGADGSLSVTFATGEARIPWIGVEDIGIAAMEIFLRGDALIGESIGIAGDHLTGEELAAHLSDALGERVQYNAVSPVTFRGFGFPGADEMGNMWQFKRDFEAAYCARRELDRARALHPRLDFATWLAEKPVAHPGSPAA